LVKSFGGQPKAIRKIDVVAADGQLPPRERIIPGHEGVDPHSDFAGMERMTR
jgi:hypothetical protein